MKTAILIPARYASTRFPGKPLCSLNGVPLIKRVYDTCSSSGLDTYVLTDDYRISSLFNDNNCIVDTADYLNGTERCAGAVDKLPYYDTFVNVQGDMPDIRIDMIEAAINAIRPEGPSTLWTGLSDEDKQNPNSVKLIHNSTHAHWFGRGFTYGSMHLGVYGYTRYQLSRYGAVPSEYEEIESLEQLRWLKAGWSMRVAHTFFDGIEINTPEDAVKWNEYNKKD